MKDGVRDMRINVELLQESPSYINPIKERELDLRGHKIPVIEHLGITKDQNDAIDFTDNDLRLLGNFPFLRRLRTLLLGRNRISHIAPAFTRSVPNISTLVLTSNSIAELSDLESLKDLRYLTFLSVMENPVCQSEYYRPFVIWTCPSVRMLDFSRVRQAERQHASQLFGTEQDPTTLASKKSRTFDVNPDQDLGMKQYATGMNADERLRIQEAIKSASSLEEISRLEALLRQGQLPPL